MLKNVFRFSVLLICLIMVAVPMLPVYGAAYSTYTYSIDGTQLMSPDAYTPVMQIDSKYMELDIALNDPRDMVCDSQGNVYIADAGNNRIVILDPYYKFRFAFGTSFINSNGIADSLATPSGVFVTDKYIYVADTENNRIVIFDLSGNYVRHLEEPESDIFEDNAIYKPIALAVDKSERIYVVSSTTYQGIIALNNVGEFQGFIGAQKVTYNALDILWRIFQTAEQRALSTQYVSTEYNNITIDDRGFIYVTTSSIDDSAQQGAIYSKSGTYAPVKKLNTAGDDVLGRTGFFGPGGEVSVNYSTVNSDIVGPSKIIDVALGPEGSWSIIDEKRSKVYTYDQDGNLLFAFGDKGMQVGNIQSIEAIVYQGSNMLILDKTANNITLYDRTEYGDILIEALKNDNDRNYDLAVEDWFKILQRNSNFDAAYIGIGKAYYRSGEWETAMDYFKYAYDTGDYSLAFKMYRQEWASKYFIIIPIVVIVVIFLVMKFFGFAKKVNKRTALLTTKRTFGQEILYAFHLMFHPFDGFWDLKHEKRGSVRGALFYVALAVVAFAYNAIGKPFIFNPRSSYSSIFTQIISLLVPLMLWVTANWCLTTLFDGEGSFKDVFIASSYSLVPIPLLLIPVTALTNVLTASEASIVTTMNSIIWFWVGILLFFGMMVTHDYSFAKNVITCLGTIVGMAFIMFIAILCSTLLVKMVGFVSSIVVEISYRL